MTFTRLCVIIAVYLSLVDAFPSEDQCLNYCANDAVCLVEDNEARCYCLPEWEGQRCEQKRSPSSIRPREHLTKMISTRSTPCSYVPDLCKNGGVCFLDTTTLACKCPYPFDGTRCEEYSVCYNYCYNGGICEESGTAPDKTVTCKCEDGFTGTRCQARDTTTTPASTTTTTALTTTDIVCSYLPAGYCNTGACVVVNNRVTCQCPPTHTGDQCQIPAGGTQPPVQTPPPVIPVQTTPPLIPGQTTPPLIPGQTTPPLIPGQTNTPQNGITCAQSPCQNGRPCYNNGNSYFCYCGTQFSGVNCENVLG